MDIKPCIRTALGVFSVVLLSACDDRIKNVRVDGDSDMVPSVDIKKSLNPTFSLQAKYKYIHGEGKRSIQLAGGENTSPDTIILGPEDNNSLVGGDIVINGPANLNQEYTLQVLDLTGGILFVNIPRFQLLGESGIRLLKSDFSLIETDSNALYRYTRKPTQFGAKLLAQVQLANKLYAYARIEGFLETNSDLEINSKSETQAGGLEYRITDNFSLFLERERFTYDDESSLSSLYFNSNHFSTGIKVNF